MVSEIPGIENWSDVLLHHETKMYATRLLSDIKRIIVHHTGQPDPASVVTPGATAKYHVNTNGWPGIGYHVWVTRDGNAYQVNPLTLISYHVGEANADSIGLALEGNFLNAPPTYEQKAAAGEAVVAIRRLIGDVPLVAHKDVPGAATLCPGNWDIYLLDVEPEPPTTDAKVRIREQLGAIRFSVLEIERWLGEI